VGAKKVNIIGFMAPAADGRDAIRMVVDKPAAAKKALPQAAGKRLRKTSSRLSWPTNPVLSGVQQASWAQLGSTLSTPTPGREKAHKRSVPSSRCRMCEPP